MTADKTPEQIINLYPEAYELGRLDGKEEGKREALQEIFEFFERYYPESDIAGIMKHSSLFRKTFGIHRFNIEFEAIEKELKA